MATKTTTKKAATKRKQPTAAELKKQRTAKNKANMLEALKVTLGNVAMAAQQCQISRSTHYDWMQEDPDYMAAVEAIGEEAVDFAENALLKAIKSGDVTATIFYLKTKGKKRGYTEKADIDLNGTITIECGFGDEQ